jgi:hypothetical protein
MFIFEDGYLSGLIMEDIKIFRTKTGFCQVSTDKIILINEGIRGQLSDLVYGKDNFRILLFYGITSLILLGLFAIYINVGNVFLSLVALVSGLVVAIKMLKYYNTTAEPIIERSQIEKVVFFRAIPVLRRAHFVVHFTARNGKKMKRLILLPGILRKGKDEAVKAFDIMVSEGLIE